MKITAEQRRELLKGKIGAGLIAIKTGEREVCLTQFNQSADGKFYTIGNIEVGGLENVFVIEKNK